MDSQENTAIIKTWNTIYPAYLDSNKSATQGRRVNKEIGLSAPTLEEIFQVMTYLKIQFVVEPYKAYPKDWLNPGRVKYNLQNEKGKFFNEQIKTKKQLMKKLCEFIPHLKTRTGAQNTEQQQQQNAKKKQKNKKN